MALSVLQLNRRKCFTFSGRSVLSLIQNKFINETIAAASSDAATNKSKNLYHTRALCYLTPRNAMQQQFNFLRRDQMMVSAAYRGYCTNKNENRQSNKVRTLPTLMDYPHIVWPSLLKTIKNWILVNCIIRPYFDQEFNMPSFVNGTKHALQVVSTALASGEFQSLEGLVSAEALDQLKASLSKMSVSQRNEIAVIKEDIYFTFPYQVGVIFDESNETVQKRFVEITMVFHVLRGLKEMQDNDNPPPMNLGVRPEYQGKISICNYRFIKQFTKGLESDWTINVANHYKPVDDLDT